VAPPSPPAAAPASLPAAASASPSAAAAPVNPSAAAPVSPPAAAPGDCPAAPAKNATTQTRGSVRFLDTVHFVQTSELQGAASDLWFTKRELASFKAEFKADSAKTADSAETDLPSLAGTATSRDPATRSWLFPAQQSRRDAWWALQRAAPLAARQSTRPRGAPKEPSCSVEAPEGSTDTAAAPTAAHAKGGSVDSARWEIPTQQRKRARQQERRAARRTTGGAGQGA